MTALAAGARHHQHRHRRRPCAGTAPGPTGSWPDSVDGERCRPTRRGRAASPRACPTRPAACCSAPMRSWRARPRRPRCTARPAPLAVDMESHVAARVARRHRLPFAAARVVSDPAHRTLPPAARVAMKPDGRVDLPAVMRSLLAHPAQLPALIRTGRDAERGFRVATPRAAPARTRTLRPGSRPACCSTWREKTNSAGRWRSREMSFAIGAVGAHATQGDGRALIGWRIMSATAEASKPECTMQSAHFS